jgi:hypothetical protein
MVTLLLLGLMPTTLMFYGTFRGQSMAGSWLVLKVMALVLFSYASIYSAGLLFLYIHPQRI